MKTKKILTLLSLYFFLLQGRAQLFSNMGRFHNQAFVGSGYTSSFGNISYGLNHTRYFKRIRKDIVGILDFSSPYLVSIVPVLFLEKAFSLIYIKRIIIIFRFQS